MADNKAVLAWANELCQLALTEARGGDTTLANRLGSNGGMKLFFDNVHGTRQVSDTSFAAFYPNQWKEITRLYEEYLRDEAQNETVDKVSAIEGKLNSLEALVREFIESQQLVEKPARKASKKTDPVVETVATEEAEPVETEGDEADAESEA